VLELQEQERRSDFTIGAATLPLVREGDALFHVAEPDEADAIDLNDGKAEHLPDEDRIN
jgi:hypothetical protein